MAKRKVRKKILKPQLRERLLELRDKARFAEAGDERQLAVAALHALEAGNIDKLGECLLEIGRIQGAAETVAELAPLYSGQLGNLLTELLDSRNERAALRGRLWQQTKGVRVAQAANTIPDEKMEALHAALKKRGTRTVAEVCEEHGIKCATYYRKHPAKRKKSHTAR